MPSFKTFVLGLKRYENRFNRLKSQLEAFHIPYLFVEGTLVTDSEYAGYSSIQNPILKRALTKGEVGCALGHLKIYQSIKNDPGYSFVLEDDSNLTNDPTEVLRTIISSKVDFDVIYLFSDAYYSWSKNVILEGGVVLSPLLSKVASNIVGCLIKNSSIQKVIQLQKECLLPADVALGWQARTGFKIYKVTRPKLIEHSFEQSIIDDVSGREANNFDGLFWKFRKLQQGRFLVEGLRKVYRFAKQVCLEVKKRNE